MNINLLVANVFFVSFIVALITTIALVKFGIQNWDSITKTFGKTWEAIRGLSRALQRIFDFLCVYQSRL